MKKISYSNVVVKKPWGQEYVCLNNKKKLCITLVEINPNQKTSLHSHPIKKTGFVILSGKAQVQIGLHQKNKFIYKPKSILVLRPGLFHSIKSIGKKKLLALEVESPVDKNDLVRVKDNYGRKNKSYEGINKISRIKKNFFKMKMPKNKSVNRYSFQKLSFNLANYKDLSKFSKKVKKGSVSIVINGCLINSKNKVGVNYGEIVKTETIKILSKYFYVKKEITILKIE